MARRLPQPPRGQPPPGSRPTAPRLGLGLGLSARQRGSFQQAAQGGRSGQWLAARPGIQQRIGRVSPMGPQMTRIQNFMGTGQNQRPPRPPTMGVPGGNMYGRPGVGVGGGPMPQQPLQPQLPPQSPLMQAVNPGMQSVINSRMQQGWTGDNVGQQAGLAAMSGGWQPMGSQPMYQNTWGGMGYGQMTGGGTRLGSGYGQVFDRNMYRPMPGLAGQMGSGGGMGGNFSPYGGGNTRENMQNFGQTQFQMPPTTYNSGGYAQQLPPGTTRSGGTYQQAPQGFM